MTPKVLEPNAPPKSKTPMQEVADLVEGLNPQEAFMRGWDYGGSANWQAGAATDAQGERQAVTPYRGRQEIESLRQLLVVKDEETPKVVFAFVPTRPLPVGDEWPKEGIKMGLQNLESMDMEMFV